MSNLRKLLFPFSVLYHAITGFRNFLYERGVLKTSTYELPVICVGNLNTGGTGKSPMIEYLLRLLTPHFKTATLSRGYKRESKGFRLVEIKDAAALTGDEPLQFKNKFPSSLVAVDANRREGIEELSRLSPEVILLDDAFQHRKVTAGFNILLTAYGDLYTNDLLLPAGNLRESATGAQRADVIVVTKCPSHLSEKEMQQLRRKLSTKADQQVYFTKICYAGKIMSAGESRPLEAIAMDSFSLVTGIANPQPLVNYLDDLGIRLPHFNFPDHHNFTEKEINRLRKMTAILTTEKDYMRLKDRVDPESLFYLPIEVDFIKDEEKFRKEILSFVKKNEVR